MCAQTSTSVGKDGFPRIFSGAGGAYVLQHLFYASKPATHSHRLQIRYIYLPSHLCGGGGDSWILNRGVPALALITHEAGVVWRWRRLTPSGGGETTLFRFSRFLGSRCRDEIGVKSLCTALMLPAEEPACSAPRGEQVHAAAMPSSSKPPPPLPPSQPPLSTPSPGGEPTAGAAAERSFNILSSLC